MSRNGTNSSELIGVVRRVRQRWDDVVLAELESGVTVKGSDEEEEVRDGGTYRFLGRWKDHPKYGHQFWFDTFATDAPLTRAGVVSYLAEVADHVGRVTANKLWDAYGSDAVDVLRNNPAAVVERGIMGNTEAIEAATCLMAEQRTSKTKIELFGLFKGRGFRRKLINEVVLSWGATAPARIRRDPFSLLVAGFTGCGFKRCDKLYLDLGLPPARLKRRLLCGWHALRTDPTGHTWFPMSRLAEAINLGPKTAKAIRLGLRAGWLAKRQDGGHLWVTEARKARHEQSIADSVTALSTWRRSVGDQSATLWPIDFGEAFRDLSDHQREKLAVALSKPVGILAGTPGTGKTFTAAALIKAIGSYYTRDAVAVCAPTGKAAVRCGEALARCGVPVKPTTIHRLLGMQAGLRDEWTFGYGPSNRLPFRFVVIDEVSMLDTDIAACLLSALAPGTHVLLVGDPYQLPPVGHGAPLRDLIAAGVPCGELSEIRRNAGMIVEACAAIKDGQRFETCDTYDADAGHNLRLVPTRVAADSVDALLSILRRLAVSGKFDPVWDTQILVALNGKSPLSRGLLNPTLQGELNPDGKQADKNPFRVGDKVICLRNNHMPVVRLAGRDGTDPANWVNVPDEDTGRAGRVFVANGELGRVLAVAERLAVAKFTAPDRTIKIPMGAGDKGDDGDEDQGGGTGCDFDLGYALSCHKMQGTEAPVVIVMIDDSPGARMVCSREWVYTAISRASRLCILIGRRETLDQYARRVALNVRKTFLKELLAECPTPISSSAPSSS